jgi:methyl-accepting chemotaxis protein
MSDTPQKPLADRLASALQKPLTGPGKLPKGSPADISALWAAHERSLARARDAGAAAQRIASSASRQRGSMDGIADRGRSLSSRVAELQTAAARLLDSLERLGLVALNAGLESARLGETEGRSLALVSEEVRTQSMRGGDAARELITSLSLLAADFGQLDASVGQAQSVVSEVTQEASRVAGAAIDTEAALLDLGERAKSVTGSDPDQLRAVAEATERARALVASLATLSGKVSSDLVLVALRPMLESLADLVEVSDSTELNAEGD